MTEQPKAISIPELQKGDLLFQLRKGGELEWVISRLFAGYNGMALNHVAIAREDGELVEAVMPKVQTISLNQFIDKSVCDGLGRPCILLARLKSPWLALVDKALAFADEQLHSPYNRNFSPEGHARSDISDRAWYCSALILEAFRSANKGESVFPETPMGFRDLETGELFPYWIDFYKKMGQPIPEGEPGSHPALLSCSDKLEVVRVVGQLPARQSINGQLA
ncbi:YiiX/YebB-like N1pC/P60 family cysteine hydrolase [Endozoicomonas sp. 8E]|uniref:YiiX/YebB-like N1pC/P60 family cysteine hydrolase n=1 Tax=Endozoicomonas sp. 8E TaxID=3035692 RepID=UPI0029393238|nr:YiiX/YebB-like N1pC/P60 family cysteine hydrolase [Endozoicomonas sp. 8E]WOG28048.1 YiiX/YebB-like N1pC/P60 family cysteine hydrolase [Endozoicomonas sp. 8E]